MFVGRVGDAYVMPSGRLYLAIKKQGKAMGQKRNTERPQPNEDDLPDSGHPASFSKKLGIRLSAAQIGTGGGVIEVGQG